MGAVVLVVDDEEAIRDVVARYLRDAGFTAIEAADGDAARAAIERSLPDVVILDLSLPKTDGLDLCRWLRTFADIPIIILSARAEESDRIVGLELGADDYVTKPFSPRELVVRVRTVLRRVQSGPSDRPPRLVHGDLVIDSGSRTVNRQGKDLTLTAREFELLWFLASNPKQVFSREQIMDRVWGYTSAVDTGTVTVHMRRLREKIEEDPSEPHHLVTLIGAGYRFVP